MSVWEIVEGDFGGLFKAIVEGEDLAECEATIKVWRNSTLLINGKPCGSVTYDAAADESWCLYDVDEGDFPIGSAINGRRTNYEAMIEFTKGGFKEHDLGFEWIVIPAPPSS